jgi:hypothetical protein
MQIIYASLSTSPLFIRVLGTDLLGTQLIMCTTVFSASIQKSKGRVELLSILRTIRISVQFCLSAMPFYCGS